MVDREGRYGKKDSKESTSSKETDGAKKTASETAGDRNGGGGDGADKKTPGAEPDTAKSEFGEVASRHGRERDDMGKRHMREMGDTHARHASEHHDMMKRHGKEVQEFMDKQAAVSPESGAAMPSQSPAMGPQAGMGTNPGMQ